MRVVPYRRLWLCLVSVSVLAGGCASYEPVGELSFDVDTPLSEGGMADVSRHWWQELDDPALAEQIEQSLAGNLTIAQAVGRLDEAAALIRRQRSFLYPRLDGVASAERFEADDSDDETRLSLGLRASYEVDLWGRIRAAVDAEEFQLLASVADVETAALAIAAEVATRWYELTVARLQLDLLASQLQTNLDTLQVLERRFAGGQARAADVLRQRQLVEASREQIILAEADVLVLEHALAVLSGRPPQSASIATSGLPTVPPLPRVGLPSELLERRPDVAAALLRLEAGDRIVAAGVRDQYPRLDLAASLATAAEKPADLFDEWLTTLSAQIVAPLFDAGLRRAEVARAEAVRAQLLASYGQTVLDAFADVEDALVLETTQAERIVNLQLQLELAESTVRQLRTSYFNGASDFLDVLTALRTQQQIERDLLDARRDRLLFRIALYRALAGGLGVVESESQEPKDDVG